MTDHTYQYCAVQLNLFSLIKLTGLVGLVGGVSWAGILFVLGVTGLVQMERFDNYLGNFLFFPVFAAFFGVVFSVVGYPLYRWVCQNLRGQKLAGIFHRPHN
ncbi:hypothetical protein D5687_00735 [Guyparkeria sp. SCN-R1]|uniref:hypothetical protein n=1 Tax=Guyparkeria sp. SCN-R1 TaxID=2341113 RepID=UPI000F64DA97|nr:hypothetical protein [Guyparkeria sp. SCN-R1]RRQ24715.1 hypothetical protein D5687_00735 [Guyparkeria sp. SCN-R1]